MSAAFLLPVVSHICQLLPMFYGGISGGMIRSHGGMMLGSMGMAIKIAPLTDLVCRRAKYNESGKKNRLFDGGGLYLELMKSGKKTWRLKYRQANGKENRLTFGEYPGVSLVDARQARDGAKSLLAAGKDPAIQRELDKQAVIQSQQETFEALAKEWLATKKPTWSDGYYKRIENSLKNNAYPLIGKLPISIIPGKVILDIVHKVEQRGALEMASRVLDAINMVFDYAVGTGRLSANPASSLAQFLQPRPEVKHFPHVDAESIPAMLARIDGYSGRPETVYALKLMMHTFPRTNELCWAEWPEFDFDDGLWRIPSERMKGRILAKKSGIAHVIPLATQVIDFLIELRALTGRYRFLFPGMRNPLTKPMSLETMNKALKIMGYEGEQTGHGFRGLASTILNGSGAFRDVVIERQLSHKERNKIKRAYDHADYMDERRALMQWWADFLEEKRGQADQSSTL